MNRHTDRRKVKRRVNWLRKHAGFGKYVIDCRGHPCIVTEVERYTDDLYGNGIYVKSLIDGSPNSCSLLHCAPQPISKQRAEHVAKTGVVL